MHRCYHNTHIIQLCNMSNNCDTTTSRVQIHKLELITLGRTTSMSTPLLLVQLIPFAHSTSTHSLLLIPTDLAHAGGLHLGSPPSAATEQRRCAGQDWPCMRIMGIYVCRGLGVWKAWYPQTKSSSKSGTRVVASRSLVLKHVSCQSSPAISSLTT